MHIDESNANPLPNDVENSNTWTAYYAPLDYVDLTAAVAGTGTNSVVYAFTKIYSKIAQQGLIYAGGVRDIRVCVNGQVVLDTTAILTYSRVNAVKAVTLNQGDNRILVKVRRSGSDFGFSLAVVNDGALDPRTTYVPYAYPYSAANPFQTARTLTAEMKRSYFGGRTVPGTFYHLGANTPPAVEPGAQTSKALEISNYPNPFNAVTKIVVRRQESGVRSQKTEIKVYAIKGDLVQILTPDSRLLASGFVWDASKFPAGIYVARIKTGGRTASRTMFLVK
jgi:hypothetical protein